MDLRICFCFFEIERSLIYIYLSAFPFVLRAAAQAEPFLATQEIFALTAGRVVDAPCLALVVWAGILHHGDKRFAALGMDRLFCEIGINNIGWARSVFFIIVAVSELEGFSKGIDYCVDLSLARFTQVCGGDFHFVVSFLPLPLFGGRRWCFLVSSKIISFLGGFVNYQKSKILAMLLPQKKKKA